jgi:hypothetical protein
MGLLPADYGFHYVIHIVNEENDGRPLLLLLLPFFFFNNTGSSFWFARTTALLHYLSSQHSFSF